MTILLISLTAACTNTINDKTPQTLTGQLNSCMLKEIYSRYDSGQLGYDRWTIAQEIFNMCKRQLKIDNEKVNSTQSLNIAASTIQALTQKSKH